jgi:hypothetical protein
MKRLILSLLLTTAVTVSVAAQQTVLAPDGTLFAIDIITSEEPASMANHFVLRMQHEGETTADMVPATVLEQSRNSNPTIAYDRATDSVFVFWLQHLGTMSSKLMFTCRNAEGEWSEAREFGNPFVFREHLRIAVTNRMSDESGAVDPDPAVSVHLAWWEFDAHSGVESARYAMLAIEEGSVSSIHELPLSEFVDRNAPSGPEDLDSSVLRHSLLQASATRDSVLITFGDLETRAFHRVRFRPTKVIADTRIRIPIGRQDGSMGAPRFTPGLDASLEAIHGDDGLVLYVSGRERLDYVTFQNGAWSESRSIALDGTTTSEVVLSAIRRLVSEQ